MLANACINNRHLDEELEQSALWGPALTYFFTCETFSFPPSERKPCSWVFGNHPLCFSLQMYHLRMNLWIMSFDLACFWALCRFIENTFLVSIFFHLISCLRTACMLLCGVHSHCSLASHPLCKLTTLLKKKLILLLKDNWVVSNVWLLQRCCL